MDEEQGVLERVTSEALHWGLGPIWGRLAPLATGAVATGAVVVVGAALLQRLAGPRGRRLLAFVGGSALVPLGLLWLYAGGDSEDASEEGADAVEPENSRERT